MKTNANDTAFPIIYLEGSHVYPGLSKREHFASMALQGRMVSAIPGAHNVDFISLASDAVRAADALIAELNKETK